MKINRFAIILKVIMLPLCLGFSLHFTFAQEQAYQELSLGIGVGYNSLLINKPTSPADIRFKHGAGLNGVVHYTFFLNRQFGIGTGVEMAKYSSKFTNKALIDTITGIPDPDPRFEGETYTFRYAYYNWEEEESALAVQIPLFLQFQTLGEYQFFIKAGGKIGQAFRSTSTTTAARMVTAGSFTYENVTYYSGPYGFRTIDNYKRKRKLDLKTPTLIASLEMGVKWQLENNNAFYTGLFTDYGINNLLKSDTLSLIKHNYSGPDYVSENSITMTPSVKKIQPFAFGVRVYFTFSSSKTFGMLPAVMAKPDPVLFDTPPARKRDDIPLDAQIYRMPDRPKPQPEQPKRETVSARNQIASVNNMPQPRIENESLKPSLTPPAERRTQQTVQQTQPPAQQSQRPVQQTQQPAQQTQRPAQQTQRPAQQAANEEDPETIVRRLFAAEGIGSMPSTTQQSQATSPIQRQPATQSFGGTEYYNPDSGANTRTTPDRKPAQDELALLGGPILGYAEGEARFSNAMARELDKKAIILRKYPQLSIIIETYSCNSPKDRPAGLKRAENIKEYFVLQGIDPNRITTAYKGSVNPIVPNVKESNRKLNRRALFIIGTL